MMDIKKIAAEIVEDVINSTSDIAEPKSEAPLGKETTEEDSTVSKTVHASAWHSTLTIKMMVSPPSIDEAVKVAKDLEKLLITDSEKVPYAMEHSHLKIGNVNIDKSYYLTSCNCTLYVCAHITIANGGTEIETDESWGPVAIEVAKKFGYKV